MKFREVLSKIWKSLPSIIQAVESLCDDGKIDPQERKALAMRTVEIIALSFGYELNWFWRLIISIALNWIARKLPSRNIRIPTFVKEALKEF